MRYRPILSCDPAQQLERSISIFGAYILLVSIERCPTMDDRAVPLNDAVSRSTMELNGPIPPATDPPQYEDLQTNEGWFSLPIHVT